MKPFMTSPDYSKRPENPMLIAIREFCFKPKKLVKTQETQIVSSLSVKTPELTPTKGHPVKNELIRRKTERLSRRLTFELNEQQKRLTTHKKTELLPMKQYPIFNGITKNPSILRSSSRKFIAVATTEKSEFPSPPNKEELVGVSRQSHENLLKVTQELKTTNHQLKRITVVPTSSTLLLVTPIASEKNIILIEVPVSYKSLNSSIGAVLAEDTTKKLYVWRGKKTSLIMKGKCADYSVQYKLYHKVGYSIQIEDENEESVDFLNAIGGKFPFEPLTVNPQNDRLCYEEKTVTMIPCGSGELKKTALTGLHSFLVRTGFNTFLWCGSKTSKNAREACAKIASTHQVGKLYVIFQGHEPFIFQALFVDWIIPKTSTKLPPAPSVKKDRVFNPNDLFVEATYHEKPLPFHSITGEFVKYKVNNLKLEIVPEEEKYILKSWECYVYLYTYPYKNIFFKALIFWLGRSASLLHRGKAAALTVDFVEKKKIDCVQMRVLEGSEQHEVLGMLGGGAVIQKNASKEGVFLYEVRNVRGVDYIRIVQVIDHTRDVNCTYILVKNDSALLMQSNTPNNTKKTQQIELIKRIGMNAGIFKELCEDTFTLNNLFNTSVPEHPHAFTLSACTGVIEYETLYELSVQTMDDNKVIVVTMKGGVYCWIKSEVTLQDTIKILRAVTEYIQCAEIKKEILVGYFVRPQHESEILRRVFFENQELNRETEQVEKIKDIFSQLTRSYTLDELKKKPKFLCSISFGQLEHFLSDADFNKAFKMSKEQFSSLPKWKQMNLKVKVGLW